VPAGADPEVPPDVPPEVPPDVPPDVPPPVPPVEGGPAPPEFAPVGLEGPLAAGPLGEEPPDEAPPPEEEVVVVVAVVLVFVVGVRAGVLAVDAPGTVSAGAGLLLAEVEPPPPPPHPASPAASARDGAITASVRRVGSNGGRFMGSSRFPADPSAARSACSR
jgi:hypothetical protein